MFWQRVRRDGTWRSLPIWVVFTALNTSVLVGSLMMWTVRGDVTEYPRWQLLLVFWLALGVYFAVSNIRTRCSRLDLTLPIPAPQLWISHFMAVTLAGLVVLMASMGVLASHQNLLSRVRDRSLPPLDLPALLGPMAAGLLLMTALLMAYRSRLWKVKGWRYWVYLVGCLAICIGLSLALASKPWLATLLPLYLAFVVVFLAARSLPATFELVPPALQTKTGGKRKLETTPESPGRRRSVRASLFWILHYAPPWGVATAWILYFFVALLGYLMGGGFESIFDSADLRFLYIPLATYMLFTPIGLLTFHLHKVDPLPVSRRRVFALLVLPTLVSFVASFVLGQIMSSAGPEDRYSSSQNVPVRYRHEGESQWVDVVPELMSVSWGGHVPDLISPSGESHPAWSVPVFKGGSTLLYSPFNTIEQTTPEFEAWLMSQAVESAHGVAISPNEILRDVLDVHPDQTVWPKSGDLSLYEARPELFGIRAQSSPQMPVMMTLILIPWLLLLALYFHTFRAGRGFKLAKVVYWGALGVLLGSLLLQVATSIVGWYDIYAARGVLAASIYKLGSNPALQALTWIACLAIIAAAYLLAQRIFQKAELPAIPVKFTLIDFSREDD